ncbi:unnamed protein product [Adineta ricciae]|uniref:Uncharacterized protein n=1 Tax=Adineta ricciae TaxID=249248 RepID=A0A816DIV4_ADIRI|nr:unnamed protein product [Adineta ricciae]CAF1633577.1 unnamed protein product [Adineta ricciae]
MEFIQNGIPETNSTSVKCVCAINPNCASQAVIVSPGANYQVFDNLTYNVSGWVRTCQTTDSLLLSTLEHFYIDSDSFPFFIYSLGATFINFGILSQSPLNTKHIAYNPSISRFPPNTPISIIVKELMVEQWNLSLSYEDFYKACAPMYCSYPKTIRKNSFIEVIVVIVSMMGGIVVLWRILTHPVVKFILRSVKRTYRNPRETEPGNSVFDQIQHSWSLI